jgi:hypothetical protein
MFRLFPEQSGLNGRLPCENMHRDERRTLILVAELQTDHA